MGEKRDGLDRLRSLNPVRESNVDGSDSLLARGLLARIIATPRPRSRPVPEEDHAQSRNWLTEFSLDLGAIDSEDRIGDLPI